MVHLFLDAALYHFKNCLASCERSLPVSASYISLRGLVFTRLYFTYLFLSLFMSKDTLKYSIKVFLRVQYVLNWAQMIVWLQNVLRMCSCIFYLYAFCGCRQQLDFLSWPLWCHVNGKMYYCNKSWSFHCGVLELWFTTQFPETIWKRVYFMKCFISKLKMTLKDWIPLPLLFCVHFRRKCSQKHPKEFWFFFKLWINLFLWN